jgi:hypothetical protein
MFIVLPGLRVSSRLSASISSSVTAGSGTRIGSTARGFFALDDAVEASVSETLILAACCEFFVVLLNGGFAGRSWDDPCPGCAPFEFARALLGFELEILNNFF